MGASMYSLLAGLADAFDAATAKVAQFGSLILDLQRRSGRKPAGGHLLRSKRLRKKAGLG